MKAALPVFRLFSPISRRSHSITSFLLGIFRSCGFELNRSKRTGYRGRANN